MNKIGNSHLCLWKKGLSLLVMASLASGALGGCALKSAYQKEEENVQGELDIYRKAELSEKEMDQSHFTMDDFKEKVKIDACITPYHLYQDGVGTYYNLNGRMWDADSNLIKLDKKAKDAGVGDLSYFGKPVKEVVRILEMASGRKAQMEKLKCEFSKVFGEHQVSVPFTKAGDKESVILDMRWGCPSDEDNKPLLNSKKTYCYSFSMENEEADQAQSIINSVQTSGVDVSYQVEKSLDFADNGATAQKLKEMLTELTGYEFSEDYDVIPVDSGVMSSALKSAEQAQQDMRGREVSMQGGQMKPFYYYRFYQELEGVSVRNFTRSILADKNTNLSEELRNEIKDSTLYKTQIDHRCSPYAEIIYDETGIISLRLGDAFASNIEPCEEKKPVLNFSDLLEPLYEYFDTVVCIDTIVYEIRLNYIADFTSGADEPIRRVLRPVWIVRYDTKINGKRCMAVCFDGYTGALVQGANNFF